MIGHSVDEEGCGVIDVDSIEKYSDMGTYNIDDVDATELGADNGVTLKSGDATLVAGDIGATYEGGAIAEDKSNSFSCKVVSKLIS